MKEKMWVFEGRSGRTWPAVLRAAAKSREEGRRVILYVPEQMTLQTERELIAGLELKGLIDIDVISPRKLRLLVADRAGGSRRRTLDAAGQLMAVHRAMTEQADSLEFYSGMTELPGAVERVREALAELRDSDITPEETETYAENAASGAVQAKLRDLNRIRGAYETLVSEHFEDEKAAWTDTVGRLGRTGILAGADLLVYGFDTVRPDLREMLCKAYGLARHVCVFLTAGGEAAADAQMFGEQHRSVRELREAVEAAGGEVRIRTLEKTKRRDGSPVSDKQDEMPYFLDFSDPKAKRENRPLVSLVSALEKPGMLQWLDEHLFTATEKPYPGPVTDAVTLYAAANRSDEAEQIAGCLLEWHDKGVPWERMAVALPAGSELEGVLRSRLRLSGIPYTTSEKVPAVSHGVCRMLCSALDCIAGGYSAESVTEIAQSGFTTLSEEEALTLVNYAEAHGIDSDRKWKLPFTKGENAEAAEAARRKLTAPIEALREDLKKARSADGSVEAVVAFLEAEGVRDRLHERETALIAAGLYREAVADRQVWKMLTEMLDQLWTLLGSRRAAIKDLKSMLASALGSARVSTLPETESGVTIGGIGHMLPGDTDALVLPGFQEGLMTAPESGWLTDREREGFEQGTGKEIGISRERRGWICRYDIYRTMTTPRKYLRVSWSLQDEGGKPLQEDGLLSAMRTVFPGIRETGGIRGTEAGPGTRTPLETLEGMGTLFAQMQEGRRDEAAEKAAVALLHSGVYGRTAMEILRDARGNREAPALAAQTAGKLFHTDEISISRLEGFAACPYKHFIDYGLRPVQQETFEYDDASAGDFFHAALDRFMKTAGRQEAWPHYSDEQVDGFMDAICAELTEEWEGGPLKEDALGIWQGESYLRRIHHAAKVLTRFAANSDFRTIATELSFGRKGPLPPLELTLADGSRVEVHGIIDRIDTYENGEGMWMRVVDNKSSLKKPDPAKMEDGEQLQLMIYLKAAEQAYPSVRPAGAMFFPIQDAEIPGTEETEEATENERLKKVRMKGLVNAREDVVRAMDRDIKPYSVDSIFNKDGSVRKDAEWAVDETVLEGLMTAAQEKAAEIVGEIRQGRIEAAPRGKEKEDSPCRYCDYRTLCHARRDSLRPRNEGAAYRDIARGIQGKNNLREEE